MFIIVWPNPTLNSDSLSIATLLSHDPASSATYSASVQKGWVNLFRYPLNDHCDIPPPLASDPISRRIAELGDGRGARLGRMRQLILEAGPSLVGVAPRVCWH